MVGRRHNRDGREALCSVAYPCVRRQQFWRSTFFRDGRTRRAVVNDIAWFAVLVAGAPFRFEASRSERSSLHGASDQSPRHAWPGAHIALAERRRVSRAPAADEASGFGNWLALGEVVFIVSGDPLVVAMTAILGSEDLGGMRAAETVFAPISLIAAAIVLPGLPAMARSNSRSSAEARQLAVRLSGAATVVTALYLVTMVVLSDDVLGLGLRRRFRRVRLPRMADGNLADSCCGGDRLHASPAGRATGEGADDGRDHRVGLSAWSGHRVRRGVRRPWCCLGGGRRRGARYGDAALCIATNGSSAMSRIPPELVRTSRMKGSFQMSPAHRRAGIPPGV